MQASRINAIGEYLKKEFGGKTVKLSLDGGFTCPNRDGSKGTGGCIFCSAKGSGDFAGTIEEQIELLSSKWPDSRYIAYFQNYTNTYAPVSVLREKYYSALGSLPGGRKFSGLAIATRPDCLSEDVLDLLSEINQQTFLWVELGLQTVLTATARTINRCCSLSDYDEAVKNLTQRNIRIVTHLIFGLPGQIENGTAISETREEMLSSVGYVCRPLSPSKISGNHIFGLKFHMLNLVRGSQMEKLCPDYVPFQSIDQYTDFVTYALRLVPPEITIHRLTADAPRSILISPEWSCKKRTILNEIHRKMEERDIRQGDLCK